jgi:BMFP domain-containing protein YqiC
MSAASIFSKFNELEARIQELTEKLNNSSSVSVVPMPQPASLVNTDDIMARLNAMESNMNNTSVSARLDALESALNDLKNEQNVQTVSPLPELDILNTKISTLEAKLVEVQTPTNDNKLNILEESTVAFQHNMNEKVQVINDNLNELNLFKTDETTVLKNKFDQYDNKFVELNAKIANLLLEASNAAPDESIPEPVEPTEPASE